jgi:hypothetical protein
MKRRLSLSHVALFLSGASLCAACGASSARPVSNGESDVPPYVERPSSARPLMRDFMGLNGHTVLFRPELYAKTCRLARDYHPLDWDLRAKATSTMPSFPMAVNGVNWSDVYTSWLKAGFEIDATLMFEMIEQSDYQDLAADLENYGRTFAAYFGPSSNKLVHSAEIGNEPGKYDDATYRIVFEAMARGLRAGDPKLKVATANMTTGPSTEYDKNVSTILGLESLYDVVNTHVYAMKEPWPTFRRSYPEDPTIDYLTRVQDLVQWRNEHAPGKPLWITEFGWDASTQPPPTEGTFSKWEDVTDEQQAQYLVRSQLVFSAMDVERAYIYFFNDDDAPMLHGSSGLTRKYEPKPAYHAVAHLYQTLGDYRLAGVLAKDVGGAYAYEYVHERDTRKRIIVAWSATGSGATAQVRLPLRGARIVEARKSPLDAGAAPLVDAVAQNDQVLLEVDETPVFLTLEAAGS